MQWKGQKTAEISSLVLKPTPNLELLVNQINNATPENNNGAENISSSKYYDVDETHNVGIPNKRNKSLSLFHINACSRPFQEIFNGCVANARANTVRCAISIFFFLKFYNFIKGIMHIHSIFKKPKTNVFTLHLLQLATEQCKAKSMEKNCPIFFIYTV